MPANGVNTKFEHVCQYHGEWPTRSQPIRSEALNRQKHIQSTIKHSPRRIPLARKPLSDQQCSWVQNIQINVHKRLRDLAGELWVGCLGVHRMYTNMKGRVRNILNWFYYPDSPFRRAPVCTWKCVISVLVYEPKICVEQIYSDVFDK